MWAFRSKAARRSAAEKHFRKTVPKLEFDNVA
jgi:hypothetical protein